MKQIMPEYTQNMKIKRRTKITLIFHVTLLVETTDVKVNFLENKKDVSYNSIKFLTSLLKLRYY